MARVPLAPPATGDLRTWALNITRRFERDYAFLRPKVGQVSLSATVSNVVTDINCTSLSKVFLTAATSQAAAIGGTTWVSSVDTGQFVVTTAAAASASCVFNYQILPPAETF